MTGKHLGSAAPIPFPPRSPDHRPSLGLMTADRFAATIGLTARTIRSYHTRGLLQPPIRLGRTPCYAEKHLVRMRQVLRLQSRGLPLEAIRALLEPDLVLSELLPLGPSVTAAVRDQPALLEALMDAGILERRADGGFHLCGVRAVLAARSVPEQGMPTRPALAFLADAISEVIPHAEAAWRGVQETANEHLADTDRSPDALLDLAIEVVRVCLHRANRPAQEFTNRP